MSRTKIFPLRLPEHTAEEFFRLFPEHGARSRFLRRMICQAISEERGRMEKKRRNQKWKEVVEKQQSLVWKGEYY